MYADPNDPLARMMNGYAAGDLAAFDALYRRIHGRLLAFFIRMSGDRHQAEDLCQTTFLKIHRARAGWIPGSAVMPWVLAIARNTLIDEQRRRVRVGAYQLTKTGDLPEIACPADVLRDLTEREDRDDTARALGEALAVLGGRQREALLLTKRSGMTTRQVAKVLGVTEMAVKLRVHRACSALRAALGPTDAPRNSLAPAP